MDVNQLLQVLWRRKLIVLAVMAVALGIAIGTLRLLTPLYESTSTLALRTTDADISLIFFGTLDAIMPVYADAADSRTTKEPAREKLGGRLADISVDTFQGTPIMKIKGRDPSPELAQQSAQAVTDSLLERVQGGELGIGSLVLSQVDRPVVAEDPVFPRTKLTLAVALLLGLLFGVGAAVLRENLATKIETPEDLERVAGVPVFGEIPNEPSVPRLSTPEELATETRLRSVFEALRDLRTNLLFSEGALRSVVITSPDGRHGKTTIAFGLAVTLARAGTRTLLVDGDLRRGRIAEMLDIPRSPGLMELLMGEAALEHAVRRTSLETLDILPGGRRAGDPGEILTSEFPTVLNQLESMYETVVIDATPVVPVSDARIMARFASANLIVASAGTATRRQVRTAIERLQLISVRPTAVVLNNYRDPGTSSYYGVPDELQKKRRRPRRATRT